jgi:hypothetical protein
MQKIIALTALVGVMGASLAWGQTESEAGKDARLPLKKASVFSSGVAYFEHSGTVNGNVRITFPFAGGAINDALKSLVVNDADSGVPSVGYLSETTLYRALKDLRIDFTDGAGLVDMLKNLQGAELEVAVAGPGGAVEQVRGRIVAVEELRRAFPGAPSAPPQTLLSLSSARGVRLVNMNDVASFAFTDGAINADVTRALDLISGARRQRTRSLDIELPGKRKREVRVSYVIPAPVWKVSYRLDLSRPSPLLQAWAIVDNDSDADWTDIELSLVSGKPVSFVQPLYPPAYLPRPMLPLSGAGFADAQNHASGYGAANAFDGAADVAAESQTRNAFMSAKSLVAPRAAPSPQASVAGGAGGGAQAQAQGEQFEFTLKKPVTLGRRQSAMLPIFEGAIKARPVFVFSGERAAAAGAIHPAVSAELTNSSGIKLPAGAITVFDGGTYAGDALLDFFNENEKRLISYGEDLSMSGSVAPSTTRLVASVQIAGGLLSVQRKFVWDKTYTIRNASGKPKKLIIEHPKTPDAALTQPASFSEQTDRLYRFEVDIRGNEIFTLDVLEERAMLEKTALGNLHTETLLAYSSSEEMPQTVRAAFAEAHRLKLAADDAQKRSGEREELRQFQISEQGRMRANLEAVGRQSPEGERYLAQLTSLDGDIDASTLAIQEARRLAESARKDYDAYIASLKL